MECDKEYFRILTSNSEPRFSENQRKSLKREIDSKVQIPNVGSGSEIQQSAVCTLISLYFPLRLHIEKPFSFMELSHSFSAGERIKNPIMIFFAFVDVRDFDC
jgi:hypothetical protein